MENRNSIRAEGKSILIGRRVSLPKWKPYLLMLAAVLLVVIVAICVIYAAGAGKAKKRYEAQLAQYKTDITRLEEQLSDRVAVYEEAKKTVDVAIVDAKVQEIGEMVTAEYVYTDAGRYTSRENKLNIDLTIVEKSFVLKWDGVIKAGIDCAKVRAEVDEEHRLLTLFLPQAEILSHSIHDDSVEVLDQNNGLFNSVKVEDVTTFQKESKALMTKRAVENGLLERAQENAQIVLTGLLQTLPEIAETYQIQFNIEA